jgi:hypothetical protein
MRTLIGAAIAVVTPVLVGCSAQATPTLSVENISLASPDLRIWDVQTTGAVRQGSSTSRESGTIDVRHDNGNTTTHDATFKVESTTLFQDGKLCHNYGPTCYCGTTTFRLEYGAALWKFGTPSNNQPVECPAGIAPTGDPEIKRSMTREELEARKQQILAERAAARAKRGD